MPVTARLSRRFYDAIGDDAANDLVNWMNDVDATYRTDLLRLNEANLDRFAAEIARQAAVSRAELHTTMERLRAELREEIAQLRADMDARFAAVDARFAAIDARFTALDVSLDTRFARFEARMLRWMLVFWTGTMVGAAATILAVLQTR